MNYQKKKIENDLIKNNLTEIQNYNKKTLINSSFICTIIMLCLYLSSLFIESFKDIRFVYFYTMLAYLIIYLVSKVCLNKNKKLILVFLYLFIGVFYALTMVLSVYVSPSSPAISFIGFILVVPLALIDRSYRVNISMTLFVIGHLILAYFFKSKVIFLDDTLTDCSFLIVSLLIGSYNRRMKIESYENARKLYTQSIIDELTGLYNRRYLYEYYDSIKQHQNIGLMIMDIDYFKKYNDYYGHLQGDECLRRISECIHKHCDLHSEKAFRYGGEEFVLIDIINNKQEFYENCNKVINKIKDLHIENVSVPLKIVTLSAGAYYSNDNISFTKIISYADNALYEAKSQGRNQLVIKGEE